LPFEEFRIFRGEKKGGVVRQCLEVEEMTDDERFQK
jgi:hypothetical protein